MSRNNLAIHYFSSKESVDFTHDLSMVFVHYFDYLELHQTALVPLKITIFGSFPSTQEYLEKNELLQLFLSKQPQINLPVLLISQPPLDNCSLKMEVWFIEKSDDLTILCADLNHLVLSINDTKLLFTSFFSADKALFVDNVLNVFSKLKDWYRRLSRCKF